jgi:hypothetical protein
VDAAESSPAAAKEAATWIRKFLGRDNMGRAYAQYNAVMLTRILTDNPAERFTRNIDNKFVAAVKELLREGRDMSVQQILRETLDYFEKEKLATNTTLGPLMEMWKKEKTKTTTRGAYAAVCIPATPLPFNTNVSRLAQSALECSMRRHTASKCNSNRITSDVNIAAREVSHPQKSLLRRLKRQRQPLGSCCRPFSQHHSPRS